MMEKIKSKVEYLLYRDIREIVAPISKEGIDIREVHSEGFGGHVSAKEFQDNTRPEVFTPSTVIISGGYGLWELEVPKDVRKRLVDKRKWGTLLKNITLKRKRGQFYFLDMEDRQSRKGSQ